MERTTPHERTELRQLARVGSPIRRLLAERAALRRALARIAAGADQEPDSKPLGRIEMARIAINALGDE